MWPGNVTWECGLGMWLGNVAWECGLGTAWERDLGMWPGNVVMFTAIGNRTDGKAMQGSRFLLYFGA